MNPRVKDDPNESHAKKTAVIPKEFTPSVSRASGASSIPKPSRSSGNLKRSHGPIEWPGCSPTEALKVYKMTQMNQFSVTQDALSIQLESKLEDTIDCAIDKFIPDVTNTIWLNSSSTMGPDNVHVPTMKYVATHLVKQGEAPATVKWNCRFPGCRNRDQGPDLKEAIAHLAGHECAVRCTFEDPLVKTGVCGKGFSNCTKLAQHVINDHFVMKVLRSKIHKTR